MTINIVKFKKKRGEAGIPPQPKKLGYSAHIFMNKKLASLTLAVTALFATTAFASPTDTEKGPTCPNPHYNNYGHTHGHSHGEGFSDGKIDKEKNYSVSEAESNVYSYGTDEAFGSGWENNKNVWTKTKDEFTVSLRYFAPKMKGGIKSNSIPH